MDSNGVPHGAVGGSSHKVLSVSSPLEYVHMKVLRFFLRLVSGWPGTELGEKAFIIEGMPHAIYNTSLTIIILIMQVWFLIENFPRLTFFEMGHMYIAILMNALSMSRGFTLCLSQSYRDLTTKFLKTVHVFYHKDQSEYSRKIYLQVHYICQYYTYFITVVMIFAVSLFNGMPTAMNFTSGTFNGFNDPVNGTFKLSLYTKLPHLDAERTFKGFVVAFILNSYITFLGGSSIIFFDLLLAIMIFHLWGHFKILIHDLKTYPKPAAMPSENASGIMTGVMFSPTEQEEITKKLKESILYHRMIKGFVDEMSQCFGSVLFIFYAFHQVSGCLFLLEISQGKDAIALYAPLAALLVSALILISIIFESIGSMSEKLRDELYCIPWEHMNTKNRKTMLLFLMSVQEPIHVKAGGVVNVGVTTMAGILRTSISYYAILRTMSTE